ncbi:hypothetical protein [Streptomyces sp. NPDC017448]|uniref:hypothetical protein n=1 Tax=Streptomyces sp. NPDC017448 TaxID=3364996 RepID=UPI00379688F4
MNTRLKAFCALAAAGLPAGRADELVARLEAGVVAGAHTWIVESHAPTESRSGSGTAGTRVYGRSPLTCCGLAGQAAAQRDRAVTHQPSPTR